MDHEHSVSRTRIQASMIRDSEMTIVSGSLKVQGLDCPTEEARIRTALESWPGLHGIDFDLEGGVVHLRFDAARTDLDAFPAPSNLVVGMAVRSLRNRSLPRLPKCLRPNRGDGSGAVAGGQ